MFFLKFKVIKSKTPTKSPAKISTDSTSPLKSTSVVIENNEQTNKENGEIGLYNVRSKLQRLGKLYSGKLYRIVHLHRLLQTGFSHYSPLIYVCTLCCASYMKMVNTVTFARMVPI